MNDVEHAFLEDSVRINKDSLDAGFEEQPQLARDVNNAYALALSRRDGCKDELKELVALTYLRVKSSADKISEAAIAANVDSDPVVVEKRKELNQLNFQMEQLLGLKASYVDRSYALRELAGLWVSGYYQSNRAQSSSSSPQLQEREIADRRAKLAEARNRSHQLDMITAAKPRAKIVEES